MTWVESVWGQIDLARIDLGAKQLGGETTGYLHKTQFLIKGNSYTLQIYKGNICHFLQIVYFQTHMTPDKVEQTTY